MKIKKVKYSFKLKATLHIVLLSFLFSQFAPYLTFKAQQYWAKKEIKTRIKQGVPESELTCFNASKAINSHSFEWIKTGKEFFYLDNLYDIVKTDVIDGKVIFKCINDKQEKQLFANLESILKKSTGNQKDTQNNSSSFFSSLYDLNPRAQYSFYTQVEILQTHLPSQKIASLFQLVLAPPPNC